MMSGKRIVFYLVPDGGVFAMRKTKILFGILVFGFSQQVFAVNLWCTGTVTRMYVDSTSRMYILPSYHASYNMICDLDSTWKGITPELCKSWFAMLQGAYHAKTTTIVYYTGVSYPSCADLPNYTTTPAPGYVMNRE